MGRAGRRDVHVATPQAMNPNLDLAIDHEAFFLLAMGMRIYHASRHHPYQHGLIAARFVPAQDADLYAVIERLPTRIGRTQGECAIGSPIPDPVENPLAQCGALVQSQFCRLQPVRQAAGEHAVDLILRLAPFSFHRESRPAPAGREAQQARDAGNS